MMSKPERIHGLDLLRGLAALGVAIYHFLSWRYDFTINSLGTFTVYIFFILSGVTMMVVYGQRFEYGISPEDAGSFYRNRVAKLISLLVVVGIIQLVVSQFSVGAAPGVDIWPQLVRYVMTATGAFALHLPGFLSSTTGAWSLGIEGAFYLMFPMVALAAMNARLSVLIGVAAFLTACQQGVMFLIRDFDTTAFWNFYITPLVFAPFFAFGILIFRLSSNAKPVNSIWTVTGMTGIAAFSILHPGDVLRSPISYLLLTALAVTCVWVAFRATISPKITPLCSFLGDISYSLYLTHWIAGMLSHAVIKRSGLPVWIELPVFLTIAVAGAYASYRLLESPARAALGDENELGCKTQDI